MQPVVYRMTSKLPAVHDWRLHKLSIGTTSPGQSVRAQEMLGMCQRTPPAFLDRNSTTNDPRTGRSVKPESGRCRCDAAPPNATPWLPHRPGAPVNASGFSGNLSGNRACRCDAAGDPQSHVPVLPSDTDSRREPSGRGGGLKITCRDHPSRTCGMNGGTGHHGPRLLVRSLSRASSMTGHGKSSELLLVPLGTPSRSIRRRDAAILNQRGVE